LFEDIRKATTGCQMTLVRNATSLHAKNTSRLLLHQKGKAMLP
jgi:hypothetical protein